MKNDGQNAWCHDTCDDPGTMPGDMDMRSAKEPTPRVVSLSAPPSTLSITKMPPGYCRYPDYDVVELAQNCEKPGEHRGAARGRSNSSAVLTSIPWLRTRRGQGVASRLLGRGVL